MMKFFRLIFMVILGIGVVFLVVMFWVAFEIFVDNPTSSKNYLFEVTLSVDGKKKTFSTIQQFEARDSDNYLLPFPAVPTWHSQTYGEALIIDINGHDIMAMVFHAPVFAKQYKYRSKDFFNAICKPLSSNYSSKENIHRLEIFEGECLIDDPDDLPLIVAASDINDMNSLYLVNPSEFQSTFSSSVEFVSARLVTTHLPVTYGVIEKRLPLVNQLKSKRITQRVETLSRVAFVGFSNFKFRGDQ